MLDSLQLAPIIRYFYREVSFVTAATFVAGSILMGLVSASAVVVDSAVVPRFSAVLLLFVLSIPVSWTFIAPIAVSVGVALAMQRWVKDGTWTSFRVCGVPGKVLLGPLFRLAILVGVCTFVLGGWVEPLGRQLVSELYRESISSMVLVENHPVRVGERLIVAGEHEDGWYKGVVMRQDGGVTYASRGRVVRTPSGLGLELLDGSMVILGSPSSRMSWSRWVVDLPVNDRRRPELNERFLSGLWDQARRTEAAGGDAAYEWAVAFKRILHPICSSLIVLGVLPLGFSRYPAISVSAMVVGYTASVRLGDALVPGLGAALGASSGLLFSLGFVAATWSSWREA